MPLPRMAGTEFKHIPYQPERLSHEESVSRGEAFFASMSEGHE